MKQIRRPWGLESLRKLGAQRLLGGGGKEAEILAAGDLFHHDDLESVLLPEMYDLPPSIHRVPRGQLHNLSLSMSF